MFTGTLEQAPLHSPIGSNAYQASHVPSTSRSEKRKAIQQRQREWLQEIVKATGLKLAQVAESASVSDTTLSRLMNNPDYTGTLSQITIERISEALRVPGPDEYGARRPVFGSFLEAERFSLDEGPHAALVRGMIAGRNSIEAWTLKTDALEAIGYLPGDILLVDIKSDAKPHDVVCAQVYDWKGGRQETVWRMWDPPFLVAVARDRTGFKPLLVDNDRVRVKGVIVGMLRPHPLSATR